MASVTDLFAYCTASLLCKLKILEGRFTQRGASGTDLLLVSKAGATVIPKLIVVLFLGHGKRALSFVKLCTHRGFWLRNFLIKKIDISPLNRREREGGG